MRLKRTVTGGDPKRPRPMVPASSTETRRPTYRETLARTHGQHCECHECRHYSLLGDGRVIL